MAETHVVTALIAKRAELAGQLGAAQAEVRRLIIDLDNVDSTLRIFQPDIDLDEVRPKPLPPRYVAYKGEVSRIIFGTLRDAHHPMTTEELTARDGRAGLEHQRQAAAPYRIQARQLMFASLSEPWSASVGSRSGRKGNVEGRLIFESLWINSLS